MYLSKLHCYTFMMGGGVYTVSVLPSIWQQSLVLGSHNACSVKAIRVAQPHHGLSNHPCMCAHICLLSKMPYKAWLYLRIYVDKSTIVQKLLETSFAKCGYGSQEVSGLDTFGISSFSWATIRSVRHPLFQSLWMSLLAECFAFKGGLVVVFNLKHSLPSAPAPYTSYRHLPEKSSEGSLTWSPLQSDSQRHSEMGSRWCRTVGWFILCAPGGRQNKSQHVSDRSGWWHRWHPCPQSSLSETPCGSLSEKAPH